MICLYDVERPQEILETGSSNFDVSALLRPYSQFSALCVLSVALRALGGLWSLQYPGFVCSLVSVAKPNRNYI